MNEKPTYEELENRIRELDRKLAGFETMKTAAMRETETKYYELVESLPAIVFELVDGKFTDINETQLKSFGYTDKSEFIGKNATDFIKKDEVSRGEAGIKKTFWGKKFENIEYRFRTKDGAFIPVHTYANPLYRNNEVIGIRGIVLDATPIKKAEEALRDSEEHYRLLAENSTDMIWTATLEGKVTYLSPSVEKLFGYSLEEGMLMPIEDYMTAETVEKIFGTLAAELSLPLEEIIHDHVIEGQMYKKDGSLIDIEINATGVINEKGDPVGIQGATRNITDRKRAEEELKKSEKKYRLLADNIIDAIWMIDLDTLCFTYASPSFERITGYTDEEMTGRMIVDILTPSSMALATREVSRELAADKTGEAKPRIVNLEHFHKDGSTVWAEVSVRFVRDQKGRPTALIGVARDITQRRLLESQLYQAQKMESIGILAGGVAHDFNNILTAIIGYAEVARIETEPGSNIERFLEEIFNSGLRARDLVRQILTFARQTDNKLKPTGIGIIVKDALGLLRSTLPATINIEHHVKSKSIIMADPTQIHQIIMNLCTNASHAMEKEGGTLKVILDDEQLGSEFTGRFPGLEPGVYSTLVIEDTGIGMSADVLESIFDPYFTTKALGEGTGLGLAVVHGIVKSCGGKIIVESQPGKGSTFKIYFPTINSNGQEKKTEFAGIAGGSEHILFLDDEVVIANMGRRLLESMGYRVTTRTSSIEGLELFRHKPGEFDLVITDMTMPNMTGDRLAAEMMLIRPDIPVILCTGYSKKISDKRASELGIRAFVLKPMIKKDLAKTIREVLDNQIKANIN